MKVTLVTIAVDETLKGDGNAALTVTLPGGVDANRKFRSAPTSTSGSRSGSRTTRAGSNQPRRRRDAESRDR